MGRPSQAQSISDANLAAAQVPQPSIACMQWRTSQRLLSHRQQAKAPTLAVAGGCGQQLGVGRPVQAPHNAGVCLDAPHKLKGRPTWCNCAGP